jgi:hypothetical protein
VNDAVAGDGEKANVPTTFPCASHSKLKPVVVPVAVDVGVYVAFAVLVAVAVSVGGYVAFAVLVAVGVLGTEVAVSSSEQRKLLLFSGLRLFSMRIVFASAGTLAVLSEKETALVLPAAKLSLAPGTGRKVALPATW